MSYPKPLSQKSLLKKYEEAKLTQEKIDFLRKFFLACSNLYGCIPVNYMWHVYKELKTKTDIPVVLKKDIVNFALIARREEHPYYILEGKEIYADGINNPAWNTLANKQLVKHDYGKFRLLYEIMEEQEDKPYYIPADLLAYAEPIPTQAEKDLCEFLGSLRVTAKEGKDFLGKTRPTANIGKTRDILPPPTLRFSSFSYAKTS